MFTVLAGQGDQSAMDAAAWVAAIAAAISLIAVAVAVWQARLAHVQASAATLQTEESKRQTDIAVRQTELQEKIHQDAAQPYVWADFRLDATQGPLLRLVVRNEGPTVAEDVRISFAPPLKAIGVSRSLDVVQQRLAAGLPSIPPGREMAWSLAVGSRLFADDSQVPMRYTVTINGRGPHGDMPELTYILDLEDFREVVAPRHGSLDDVAKAIRDLKSSKD